MAAQWDRELLAQMMQKARNYTLGLIADVPSQDWYRMPVPHTSHIAWHVGHIAVSQYRLAVVRVRGERPEDAAIVPPEYSRWFSKGSVPHPYQADMPTAEALRQLLERVHHLTLTKLSGYSRDLLSELSEPTHPMFATKGEAIQWAAMHEMLHTGHIAALRRALGYPSLR